MVFLQAMKASRLQLVVGIAGILGLVPAVVQAFEPSIGASFSEQRERFRKANGAWKTPAPIYPAATVQARIVGQGEVCVTTDRKGFVREAYMTRSTGSSILDDYTITFARAAWRGPSIATTTFQVFYRYRDGEPVGTAALVRVTTDATGHPVRIENAGTKNAVSAEIARTVQEKWAGAPNSNAIVPIAVAIAR